MSEEMLETLTLAGIVLAVTFLAVGVILLLRRRSAGKTGLSSGHQKKKKKAEKQQRPAGKKEKGKKKNKKQKNKALDFEYPVPESDDTVPLIQTDRPDSTILLDEQDAYGQMDQGGATVLLSQTEEPEFRIEFEIGFAESKDVIE